MNEYGGGAKVYIKCPYFGSVINVGLIIGWMALGTVGLYFLNLWGAVVYLIYSLVFMFWAMPVKHCQYCYYRVKETPIDNKKGELLPLEKWKELYLKKHVDCAKKWSVHFFILWFGPIIGISISFFLWFDIVALLSLIGFIVMLAAMMIYVNKKVCPTCAFMEECHASF